MDWSLVSMQSWVVFIILGLVAVIRFLGTRLAIFLTCTLRGKLATAVTATKWINYYGFIPLILLISAITVSVVEDLRRQKIPNLVTFPTMVLALVFHSISSGMNGFIFSAGGLALGMGLFMIPYMMGGMGAGDVKLMGASGAVFGPKGIIIASILVFLAGGLYGLIISPFIPICALFMKRLWMTIHIFMTTFQFIRLPEERC